ncbi:hypothetical protein ANO11243_068960 [Dothideomycetidae sp. 11243]|nr:hypothetical protein ANO11243_068960 [fungal sp. No.11243]
MSSTQTWYEGEELDDLSSVEELRAPPPVQNTREDQTPHLEDISRQESGQRSRSIGNRRQVNTAGLDELTAPAPSHHSQLVVLSYLIFFSLLGTLARLGVQWLTFYPGAPVVTPVLWANVGGSFFMGFLSEDRRMFQHPSFSRNNAPKPDMSAEEQKAHHVKVKKTIPLYIGLATGFCGSFTSFSSFMRDAFLALSNDLTSPYSHPIPRHNGYSVLAVLAVLLYEPALSLAALFVGAHAALLFDTFTPSIPYTITRHILDPAIVILAFGSWIAVVLVAVFPPDKSWRGEALLALIFAPPGCLARFYASVKLNPLVPSFPTGTFAVNVFGSTVLAVAFVLQRVSGVAGLEACMALQGLQDGFCGCLTTVSTWVAELQGLRRRHAYIYGVASVGAALAIMVVIMGSVKWGVGWVSPVCATGRTSS